MQYLHFTQSTTLPRDYAAFIVLPIAGTRLLIAYSATAKTYAIKARGCPLAFTVRGPHNPGAGDCLVSLACDYADTIGHIDLATACAALPHLPALPLHNPAMRYNLRNLARRGVTGATATLSPAFLPLAEAITPTPAGGHYFPAIVPGFAPMPCTEYA